MAAGRICTAILPKFYPYDDDPDFNLVTAMADDAIDYMKTVNALNPDQPFFIYYAPGATHAPHHPTPEWIDKISKMKLFDEGWHKLSETIFANQKRLGVHAGGCQADTLAQ